MDLYDFLSVQLFLVIPFVIYLLLFRPPGGRSWYSNRDIFYPIKFYLAKKVVRAAQDNRKGHQHDGSSEAEEPALIFSSKRGEFFNSQAFQGCDLKGNSLSLKFTLRHNKLAEVTLVLKLANGSIYSFPGSEKVHVTYVRNSQWKINGLVIETIQPWKRVRIVYNGLLQNLSFKLYEKIEHVQFNFIFNCCSAPKFFPDDCNASLLAETLATTKWADASWKEFLMDQPVGYQQFGALLGVLKGDSFPEEQVLNLPASRSKYGGPDERFMLNRELNVFLAETHGVLIYLRIKSLKDPDSQLNYGYVCHKNNKTVPISFHNIRLQNITSVPDLLVIRINVPSDEYTCVLNINKSSLCDAVSSTGYEVLNYSAVCDVNTSDGKALVDFVYFQTNRNIKKLNLKPLSQMLTPKAVDSVPEDFVANINSENAKILELTGGKGNSLALLTSIKTDAYSVPAGFIVTVNAFKHQLTQNQLLQKAVNKVKDIFCGKIEGKPEEACTEAVRIFNNEPVAQKIAIDIVKSLRQVTKDSTNDSIDVVSWAVRSSAIGEDSEELSAAGQNETILGCVIEEEVLKAVAACWASLFTYQSVQYRWQHGLPVDTQMAVVIQKMVPAESAGVLFTWHPSSSNPSQMVLTSNYGLGETVVSGKSDPDTFILNRTYDGKVCLLDQVIGTKEKIMKLTEEGVKEVQNQEKNLDTEKWSLSKEQVIRLGKIGVMLEEAFGGPRDIEWAFYKGDLYLLQSRPITTLNTWSEFELLHEFNFPVITQNSITTIANCGEVFPTAITSLTRSTSFENMDKGMQLCIIEEVDPYVTRTLCSYYFRVMIDVVLCLHMNARHEDVKMEHKILDLAVFGHPFINEKISALIRARLGPSERFGVGKELLRQWVNARKVKKSVQQSNDFVRSFSFGLKNEDTSEEMYLKITRRPEVIQIPGYHHAVTTSASVFWQMICMNILVRNNKELTTEHYEDFANILSSCEDVVSAEVPKYLEKIAKIIREEGYTEEFCTIKPEFGMDWLRTKCPSAYKVFEEFLDRHGHRGLGEFELIEETWGSKPSLVIPMVQANSKHLTDVGKQFKTINEIMDSLKSPVNSVTKIILKYIMGKLRVTVGKREQSKSALIFAINHVRLAYKQLAKRMVQEGLLPEESLIFHLSKYEIGEIIRRRSPLLVAKAFKRQKLYPKWKNLKFSEISYGFPEPEKETDVPVVMLEGTKCTGTPVCTGSVTGRACVITALEEIDQLGKGDILITYCTDIGWSPYFPMLSGVVTELGGLVSHGAVVAREYGLPCIVGAKHATKLFETGDIVHLSGKTGELGKI